MRKYIFYFLIVLEVGGGFTGICAIIIKTQWSRSMPTSVWIFAIIAFFMFLIGIIAGLSFIERPRLGIALSAIYQALQIPVFLSPLFSYKFFVGFLLGIGLSKGKLVMLIEPGAGIKVSVFRSTILPLIGVNVFALVLFIYLLLQLRQKKELFSKVESSA